MASLAPPNSSPWSCAKSSPIIPPLQRFLADAEEDLAGLRDRELLRTLTTIEEVRGVKVRVAGQWLVSWCTNDYLGLSQHPQVIQAACEAAQRWGVGARASRLLAGSTTLHAQLEARLAAFFGAESALVFPSGYLANLGTLGALLGPEDVVLVDRLAHASLIDAARASRARLRVFPHNDVAELARLLARLPRRAIAGRRGRRIVVSEGLFSMDGDRAPLAQLADVVNAHEALLYLDDAHGAFVLGSSGRGSPQQAGVPHAAMIYMGTLGKALGAQGGFVVGAQSLIRFLQNRARHFLYATALATPLVAAALEALRLVEEDPAPRARLAQRVRQLQATLASLTDLPRFAPSHIAPIVVGSARRARALSASLWERGVWAPAIRPPTVPAGTSRLRLSVTALHTEEQIGELADALRDQLNPASQ
ncbi:MAG: 8-amino-7-oxononanoate synthase [Candidatus Omnitrophica bacterium]|nr:8-amino-7-oxononanoate synthase [Candidatus Omnitrophota bacterium]